MSRVRTLAVAAALLFAGGCSDGARDAERGAGAGAGADTETPRHAAGRAFLDLPASAAQPWDAELSLHEIARRLDTDAPRRPGSRALDLAFENAEVPGSLAFLRTREAPVVRDGRLVVELGFEGNRSDAVWQVSADTRDITHLRLRLGDRPRGGSHSELRVSWRGPSQLRFADQRPVIVPYRETRDGVLVVPLASNPKWTGRIEALRFNLGGHGRIEIESIRGFHLADLLRIVDDDPEAFHHTAVELSHTRRPALRVSPTSRLVQRVRVAPGDALLTGLGLHPLSASLASSATRFDVRVVTDDGDDLVESFRVPSDAIPVEAGWHDVSLDLSRFAGREVAIELRTQPLTPDGAPTGIPLWSAPRLRAGERNASGPNLLLISVDTLRADHLESYGYAFKTSPAISRLAAQGTRFAHAISHAPSTLPSHASLFTGIPALKNRLNDAVGLRLPAGRETLAEMLAAAGFATGAVTGGAYLDPYFGLSQGFETYAYAKTENHATGFDYSDIETNSERALRWIERNRDRRFFLFFHTYEVHSPYDPREASIREYLPAGVPVPEHKVVLSGNGRFAPLEPPRYAGWHEFIRFRNRGDALTPAIVARIRASYDSEIRTTDGYLERLFEALEAQGLLDETLVVLTSDHGEAFLEHGRTEHGHLYETNLHVPLLLRYPARVPAGLVVSARVQLADVLPTALELLGIEAPPSVEGASLVPYLARGEETEPPPRAAVSYNTVSGISYVGPDGGKLIANVLARHPSAGRVEFYDLTADPEERVDRFARLSDPRRAELFEHVDTALADLPGTHLRLLPDHRARFSGTLELTGSHSSLWDQLRTFPLVPGQVRFAEDGLSARVETPTLARWWIHTHVGAGRLRLRGAFEDDAGNALPIDEAFALDALPPRAAARARRLGAPDAGLGLALEAYVVNPAAGDAADEDAPSDETLRQLEALGYVDQPDTPRDAASDP